MMLPLWAAGFVIALGWLGWASLPAIQRPADILPAAVETLILALIWPAVLFAAIAYLIIWLYELLLSRKD